MTCVQLAIAKRLGNIDQNEPGNAGMTCVQLAMGTTAIGPGALTGNRSGSCSAAGATPDDAWTMPCGRMEQAKPCSGRMQGARTKINLECDQ